MCTRDIISLQAAYSQFPFFHSGLDVESHFAVTRLENMDFCKRMMIQQRTRLCSEPILLVSLDLWILAQLLALLAKSVNSSEICLAHITSLCMQIGTLDAVKRSIQCKASSASRRNYLAIQIGGFLRRFAQRSVETSGRFWSNPGRRVFLARKSSGHGTVNLCGSSILVKDRDNHICDHDQLRHHKYLMVPPLQIFQALRVKE